MAFWSSEKLLAHSKFVDPFDPDRVMACAYELSMGAEAAVSSSDTKLHLQPGEQVCIPPGQFAHLATEEVILVPPEAIGFISIKTSIKQKGLVNVSGFHVDPGFRGQLVFSVYNAGPRNVILSRGTPTFLLWLSDLDTQTKKQYDGTHQGQRGISDEVSMALQGTTASPPELARRITELEGRVTRWFTAAKWILLTIAGTLLSIWLKSAWDHRPHVPADTDSVRVGAPFSPTPMVTPTPKPAGTASGSSLPTSAAPPRDNSGRK